MPANIDPLLVEYVAQHQDAGAPITLVTRGGLLTGRLASAVDHTYAPTVASTIHDLEDQGLADLETALAALGADADKFLDRSMLEQARARVRDRDTQCAGERVTHIALTSARLNVGDGTWVEIPPCERLFRVRADDVSAWGATLVDTSGTATS